MFRTVSIYFYFDRYGVFWYSIIGLFLAPGILVRHSMPFQHTISLDLVASNLCRAEMMTLDSNMLQSNQSLKLQFALLRHWHKADTRVISQQGFLAGMNQPRPIRTTARSKQHRTRGRGQKVESDLQGTKCGSKWISRGHSSWLFFRYLQRLVGWVKSFLPRKKVVLSQPQASYVRVICELLKQRDEHVARSNLLEKQRLGCETFKKDQKSRSYLFCFQKEMIEHSLKINTWNLFELNVLRRFFLVPFGKRSAARRVETTPRMGQWREIFQETDLTKLEREDYSRRQWCRM